MIASLELVAPVPPFNTFNVPPTVNVPLVVIGALVLLEESNLRPVPAGSILIDFTVP